MEVTFSLNQQEYTIRPNEVPIDTSLLVFIRSHARLTGTKFMCLEGGCGACVVNVSGIAMPSGDCLWPVYACNGLNVTTIEGIGNLKTGYHPIQKALYHFNGSQCGYCSPGMVMNMFSLLQANDGKVTMQQVENSFSGNICRCTGYRPILDAFKSLAADACTRDIEDLTLDLCYLNEGQKATSINDDNMCRRKCNRNCNFNKKSLEICTNDGKMWLRPLNLAELLQMLTTKTMHTEYMLVGGNTAHGVHRRSENISVFIDIKSIPELHTISADESSLTFGGNVSLTELMQTLRKAATKCQNYSYATQLADHLDLVANVPVRNVNIQSNNNLKCWYDEFSSDIFLLLETINVKLNIVSIDGLVRPYSPKDFLSLDMQQKVILNIVFPKLSPNRFVFRSYKIMRRAQNAHAMINAAFLFELETNATKSLVKSCRICYGGINPKFVHAEATEKLLTGNDNLYTNESLEQAVKSLQEELVPDSVLPDPPAEYRKNLAIALFYRCFLSTAPAKIVKSDYISGSTGIFRPLSSGIQTYQSDEKSYPMTQPLLKTEGLIQCAGEAEYVNDMFSSQTVVMELWAAFVPTTKVHSKVIRIDASKAMKIPGVEAFFGAKDIPGDNTFTPFNSGVIGIRQDEVVFVAIDGEVEYYGQPCGMILAKTMNIANAAISHVEIDYQQMDDTRPIIPSIFHGNYHQHKLYIETEQYTFPPNQEFKPITNQKKLKGELQIGGQFHFSMEPQTTFCFPNDNGGINIYSASHWFDLMHVAISKCLKIPQHKIFGSFKRLGGSYGAKISRASQIGVACALACHLTRRPVRFVMNIESNMMVAGKRYAYSMEYDASFDSTTGHIAEFTASIIQDCGVSLNDDVSLFMVHTLNNTCYSRNSEWKIKVDRVKTDAPGATWCRGPGTTEGIALLENLMEQIAFETKLDAAQVRLNNLDNNGSLPKIFTEFLKNTEYYERKQQIEELNKLHRWHKKGIAVSVMQFPIRNITSFIAYVVIYHFDGTVAVSHNGAEMGQGINTKVAQVVAYILGISVNSVTVAPFDTMISANRSLTAMSVTSESVCMAAKKACERILQRLQPVRDKMPNGSWIEIVGQAWMQSISLSEKEIYQVKEAKPYNIIGCACAEIDLDVLTGNVQLTRVDIVEDTGKTINPLIDVGQIEGAFMMGVGYWLTERLDYDGRTGELVTNRTWTYKVPGAKDIPVDFRITFLQNINNDGVFSSKATGEPALTLSIVVTFALRHAIEAIRMDNHEPMKWFSFGSGNTPDVVFSASGINVADFKLN